MKLLILDVDGVLTDGKKYYGIDGLPFIKTFADKDWTAIKRFRALGITVIFLTGDSKINELVGKNRNIPVYLSRGLDKENFIPELEKTFNCSVADMAYVGDDLFDIGIMKLVNHSFCTLDSPKIVKDSCKYVIDKVGGDNVIVRLFEMCEESKLIPSLDLKTIMEKIKELDKTEVF